MLAHSPRIITENLVLLLDAANPRNFNLTAVEVLVVAGGGGGGGNTHGGWTGGGGGAGGFRTETAFPITPGVAISVTVGDGGAGGAGGYAQDGGKGGNSTFSTIISTGGGGGGRSTGDGSGVSGLPGGSGGGGAGNIAFLTSGGLGNEGAYTPPEGNNGGASTLNTNNPGSGGGAGAAGNGGSAGGTPTAGGAGTSSSITGTSVTYATGGGAQQTSESAGAPNTGNGGGSRNGVSVTGGAGGSGIIIVRYQGPQKAIGGTVTSVGGYTIHTFTTSGNFTPLVNTNGSAVLGLSDLYGNGNFGTSVNGPTYSSANGGSIVFDGSNTYVNIGIGKGVNQFSGDFAVSAWVFRNAGGPTLGNIIGDYYTGSVATTNEWQIMMSSTAQFIFYRVGSGNVIPSTASGYSASQWINVVVSRIGSAISMYANNNLIASTTNSEVFGTATGNLNIGIDGNNSEKPLSANISNVMIYKNKGLTAAEIQQNYNALKSRFGL